MITVQPSQFNGTKQDLDTRVEAFRQALAAHALTVGVPAPLDDEIIMRIARSNETYAIAQAIDTQPSQDVIPDWGKVIIAELANKPDASKEIIELAATSNIAVAQVEVAQGRLQP